MSRRTTRKQEQELTRARVRLIARLGRALVETQKDLERSSRRIRRALYQTERKK